MIDRNTCPGKLEVLYRELEKRADYLGVSTSDLDAYGCTITTHNRVLDCVIGFDTYMDECGHVTTKKHRKYSAYHFVTKRSLHFIGNKNSVLVTADWLEDAICFWKQNLKAGEHMVFAMLYEDAYYFFDIERLVNLHEMGTRKGIDRHTKVIPCYNPQTNTKEKNRIIMLPVQWGERYGYRTKKEERDAIYRGAKNPVTLKEVKELEKIPLGKEVTSGISPFI